MTSAPDNPHHRLLERMYAAAPINGPYFSPRITVGDGEATVRIRVKSEFIAAQVVHGAVYFKAADDAAYFAANSLVTDVMLLTSSFTIYFTRPITEGELCARGRVVHRSKRLFIAECVISDAEEREIGRGSGTFMRSEIPIASMPGYDSSE